MVLEYCLLQEYARGDTARCIARSFFENDVLGVALGIDFHDWLAFAFAAAGKAIDDNVSFVTFDFEEVVAANLCYDFEKYSPDDYNAIRSFSPICDFMDKLYGDYRPDGKVLHFSYIGVLPGYLKEGVAFELARRNIDFAREKGYEKIVLEATSPYSQKNASRLGFRKIGEIFYRDFEYEGEKIFRGITETPSCLLMEMDL